MGFKSKGKRYTLDFAETELDGLTVVARGATVGQMMELDQLQEVAQSLTEKNSNAEQRTAMGLQFFAYLAGMLISWDFEEDDGTPRPLDSEGLSRLERSELNCLLEGYRNALQGVPAPLEPRSIDGSPSVVASMPMDVKSPSLAS